MLSSGCCPSGRPLVTQMWGILFFTHRPGGPGRVRSRERPQVIPRVTISSRVGQTLPHRPQGCRCTCSRDPEGPHDLPLSIAQRELGRRNPADLAVRQRLLLLHVHERLSGADDLLLVPQSLLRVLAGEDVEVGSTDGERRSCNAKPRGRISVDACEATVEILEVDGVRDVVHQRLEQEDCVLELQDRWPGRPQN
jgi:hypothetical protein